MNVNPSSAGQRRPDAESDYVLEHVKVWREVSMKTVILVAIALLALVGTVVVLPALPALADNPCVVQNPDGSVTVYPNGCPPGSGGSNG
jgi:hypothetical protein